jgi:hypothetical protein
MAAHATIADNLASVRERIARAAQRAGRDPGGIRLVAVSKTMPADAIRAAYAAGQRDFGENYVQELVSKASELLGLPGLVWHMIGHVQRNKSSKLVPLAPIVHSLDSARLARDLGERAAALNTRLDVLVEVNVGGEAQKHGVAPAAVADVLDAVQNQPALSLSGLMTVPPHTPDPAGSLRYFEALVRLRDELGGAARLPELSMGMTHDLEWAILAGATLVRVGTAIFGARQ